MRVIAAVFGIAFFGSGAGIAQAQEHAEHPLGTVDFRISCSEPAQAVFNRAVALLHHMTYPRAREAFEQVAKIDPRCAMAHWGIAMTLFQPLWPTRPGPEDLRRGWTAVETARSLGPPTQRERLLVDAAAAFFGEPESTDYWRRIRRWEQAMETANAAFPDDADVAAFYALAHLAVAPSDTVSAAHAERAAARLLTILERNPDHPGAMHYLVHANDAPGRETQSPDVVRKYETTAPRNPHALHMPTHVYTRQGDWDAVVRGNLLAAEAALEHPAGDRGQFVWDEFPHAIEYLVYAHLQRGADDEAAAQLKRLHEAARLQPTFKTAFHLASTRARYALERHAWAEAMSLAPREPASLDWDRFTWPEAVTWFARGLGAAREGRPVDARAAVDRLLVLETAAGHAGEKLFARNILVLRLEVGAWLAHAERDTQSSVALLREAADLELATPKHAVTPGPTLPAQELLGDLFLEQARPVEALAAYRQSLELYPRRFNSVLGAARSARAAGDEAAARGYYHALLQLAASGTRRPGLDEARALPADAQTQARTGPDVSPLAIGETFTIQSRALGETRRINVYLPPAYAESAGSRLPVLYMPDGGIQEDFLHVAGLLQVSVGNGTMRPFLLVGIENTARRRDLTGPTSDAEDRKIAPEVGGSAAFREFIRAELMPAVRGRYRTTGESAIVGESLAGLFVLETFFLEPDLFDTYIAFDPSLWWNRGELVDRAAERIAVAAGRSLYLASSSEGALAGLTRRLVDVFAARAPSSARRHYEPMPEESHATIYHPAALRAFRRLFKPDSGQQYSPAGP